jgi:hypothetical protein
LIVVKESVYEKLPLKLSTDSPPESTLLKKAKTKIVWLKTDKFGECFMTVFIYRGIFSTAQALTKAKAFK